jgi:hypothetical protein
VFGSETASRLAAYRTFHWAMIRNILIAACCIAVSACAADQKKVVWTRTDGRPEVSALTEIDQADCRDEVQKSDPSVDRPKLFAGQSKADDKFASCMTALGYRAAN